MKRDVGIELLRCCMMLLIVLHHCCLFGVHKHPAVGGLSASTLFAVDVFVLISGWYGVRFSGKKVLKLLEQGVFAVLFVGLIAGLTGAGWEFRFSLGWFGNAYLALLCVSPIINAGIDGLDRGGGGSCLYAGIMFVCWIPCGLNVNGWFGHSFNTMLFVYVTGRMLSACRWVRTIRLRYVVLVFLVCEAVNLVWAWMGARHPGSIFCGTRDYDAPFILLMAVCVFILFLRMRWCEQAKGILRIVPWMAPSMFMIYLLHNGVPNTAPRRLIAWAESCIGFGGGAVGELLSCCVVAVLVFTAGFVVDAARRIVRGLLAGLFQKR